jgi:hypothetical protein
MGRSSIFSRSSVVGRRSIVDGSSVVDDYGVFGRFGNILGLRIIVRRRSREAVVIRQNKLGLVHQF